MRVARVVHALVTAAALALIPARAFAVADVVVPEGCGDAAAFESELQSRVGEHADDVLAKTHVRIDRDGDGYRLSMRVGDEYRTAAATVRRTAIAALRQPPARR